MSERLRSRPPDEKTPCSRTPRLCRVLCAPQRGRAERTSSRPCENPSHCPQILRCFTSKRSSPIFVECISLRTHSDCPSFFASLGRVRRVKVVDLVVCGRSNLLQLDPWSSLHPTNLSNRTCSHKKVSVPTFGRSKQGDPGEPPID